MILKACGFIEEQRARIVKVEPNLLQLRIGVPWPTRIIGMQDKQRPVDVTLEIKDVDPATLSEDRFDRLPSAKCSLVEVNVKARLANWKDGEFEQLTRRLMWSLRGHFLSPA